MHRSIYLIKTPFALIFICFSECMEFLYFNSSVNDIFFLSIHFTRIIDTLSVMNLKKMFLHFFLGIISFKSDYL